MSTVARLKIKEIDRDQKRQWMMVINTTVHVKSDLCLIYIIKIIKNPMQPHWVYEEIWIIRY